MSEDRAKLEVSSYEAKVSHATYIALKSKFLNEVLSWFKVTEEAIRIPEKT